MNIFYMLLDVIFNYTKFIKHSYDFDKFFNWNVFSCLFVDRGLVEGNVTERTYVALFSSLV